MDLRRHNDGFGLDFIDNLERGRVRTGIKLSSVHVPGVCHLLCNYSLHFREGILRSRPKLANRNGLLHRDIISAEKGEDYRMPRKLLLLCSAVRLDFALLKLAIPVDIVQIARENLCLRPFDYGDHSLDHSSLCHRPPTKINKKVWHILVHYEREIDEHSYGNLHLVHYHQFYIDGHPDDEQDGV